MITRYAVCPARPADFICRMDLGAGAKQIHLILEGRDYRRVVIAVENWVIELDSVQK